MALHRSGWLIKAMVIPAVIALVTMLQSMPVAAPKVSPEILMAETSTPAAGPAKLEASMPILSSISQVAGPLTPTIEPTAIEPVAIDLAAQIIDGTATAQPIPTVEIAVIPTDPHDLSRLLVLLPTPTPTATPRATLPISPAPGQSPLPTPTLLPTLTPTADAVPRTARVPILMYHYISVPPPDADRVRRSLSVAPADFEAQMRHLQERGYHTITLSQLYGHLTQGQPLPPNPIILTFDDGYVDAVTNAMPILVKYGFVGTFFVLTGPADRGGQGEYLSWDQIAAMDEAGMDIELHSREHCDLRGRSNDFLVYQIAGGREVLEGHLGRPVRWFAYPSGLYDEAVIRVAASAGLWGSVTTAYGQTQKRESMFELARIRIAGSYSLETFAKILTSGP